MNKRLTPMSVREMRTLIEKLRYDLKLARRRLEYFETRLETCRVTEAGLRDRVAYLTALQRKEGP